MHISYKPPAKGQKELQLNQCNGFIVNHVKNTFQGQVFFWENATNLYQISCCLTSYALSIGWKLEQWFKYSFSWF